eukprot:GDKK01048954.1.p1 GENE.GDKK01048954.1~~GDKK01048954.1.p1  ORF type:complete len:439 (+),score=76.17 GDKK01048954.1:866-2182(+)
MELLDVDAVNLVHFEVANKNQSSMRITATLFRLSPFEKKEEFFCLQFLNLILQLKQKMIPSVYIEQQPLHSTLNFTPHAAPFSMNDHGHLLTFESVSSWILHFFSSVVSPSYFQSVSSCCCPSFSDCTSSTSPCILLHPFSSLLSSAFDLGFDPLLSNSIEIIFRRFSFHVFLIQRQVEDFLEGISKKRQQEHRSRPQQHCEDADGQKTQDNLFLEGKLLSFFKKLCDDALKTLQPDNLIFDFKEMNETFSYCDLFLHAMKKNVRDPDVPDATNNNSAQVQEQLKKSEFLNSHSNLESLVVHEYTNFILHQKSLSLWICFFRRVSFTFQHRLIVCLHRVLESFISRSFSTEVSSLSFFPHSHLSTSPPIAGNNNLSSPQQGTPKQYCLFFLSHLLKKDLVRMRSAASSCFCSTVREDDHNHKDVSFESKETIISEKRQ